jgi:hypothetical protein
MTAIVARGADAVGGESVRRYAFPYRLQLAATIVIVALLILATRLHAIATWQFVDSDDLMRLQEVRDWLGGQSWFDVSQHRVDPPFGLSMHWSRLVDVPLAAIILLVRPFAGEAAAELSACVIVPLITFAAIATIVAALARRLLGNDKLALLGVALCAADFGTFSIAPPMRIDHHGWQAACGLAMVLALVGPRTARKAVGAGLCAALWMQVSLEGLIFTAGCGVWLGVRWIVAPHDERAMLPAYMAGTAVGSLSLFLIAHGGALFNRTMCDAVSPVHMTVFAAAAAGAGVATWSAPRHWLVRAAALGLVAVACAAIYKVWAPQCSGGAFAALTPLDYRLWYLDIAEGRPLWTQPADFAILWICFPVVSLAAATICLRVAPAEFRAMAFDYIAFLVIATAIGVCLSRASAFANILAVPGVLMPLALLLPKVVRIKAMPVRVTAHAGLIMLAMPWAPALAVTAIRPSIDSHTPRERSLRTINRDCAALGNVAHLDAIAPTLFMTTLVGAEPALVATRHSVVGAAYHRNVMAMDDTIRFFVGDDATARTIVERHHARYVAICPGDTNAIAWTMEAPHGLAARLPTGDAPAWLRPVAVPGLRYMRVYAVTG